MNTTLTGPAPWQSDGIEPHLVAELHRSVGEALTAAHVAHEEAGRGRLAPSDERALARKLLADELRRLAAGAYADGRTPLDEASEAKVTAAVLDRIHGLARLQPLLDDPHIRDIHISGARRVWLTLRDGTKVRGPAVADTDDDLVELIATAARRIGRSERRWDHAHPELNLQLPNGDRLHALMAVSGRPTVTIRRHDFDIHRVAQLIDSGVCDDLLASFLSAAVRARTNIIVAGGTGTGKTTTLRCLINEIPTDERLITIEDSLEIGLERFEDLHPDHETLEAREANTEGVGSFTLADLVRSALRMDPQRVIVGEVRGAEVLPMLLAMSQGNDGSMCSIHADSSKGVFGRLAMYAAMTPERLIPEVTNLLVANAVDLIVHLGWVSGERRVTSVRQVTGAVEGGQIVSNELWRPDGSGVGVPAAPPTPEFATQLESYGFDASAHAAAQGVVAMSTLILASLSAGVALGLLLIVAGLTGRQLIDSPSNYVRRMVASSILPRAAVAATAGVVALAATGWLVGGIMAAAAALVLPGVLGGKSARQRAIDRTEAIASWTEMIRDSIVAASGLEEAIVASAPVAPRPIATEVRTMVRRLDHQRLPDALVAFGEDLDHPSGDLVVAALVIASRMEAADLSGLLSRLAEATRGEARMRIRVEVGRTRVRTATKVIIGVVIAAVVFLAIANRSYLTVYDSFGGQVMLAIVGGIFALGGWLLTRMAEIDLPERFTARAGGPTHVGAET